MPIKLEVLSARNLEWLRNLRNGNSEWFLDTRPILHPEDQARWFRQSCERGDLNLVIIETDTDERVGFISVYDIVPSGLAKIGRMMVENKFKHQGYMQRALFKICDICRNYLLITELSLEVKDSNIIARDFYTKMGFITYGFTSEFLIMRKRLA